MTMPWWLQHRDHLLPFPLVFFDLDNVAASCWIGLFDLILVSVVRPPVRSHVIPLRNPYSFQFFHVGFRASLAVRAHSTLLVLHVTLHLRGELVLTLLLSGILLILLTISCDEDVGKVDEIEEPVDKSSTTSGTWFDVSQWIFLAIFDEVWFQATSPVVTLHKFFADFSKWKNCRCIYRSITVTNKSNSGTFAVVVCFFFFFWYNNGMRTGCVKQEDKRGKQRHRKDIRVTRSLGDGVRVVPMERLVAVVRRERMVDHDLENTSFRTSISGSFIWWNAWLVRIFHGPRVAPMNKIQVKPRFVMAALIGGT